MFYYVLCNQWTVSCRFDQCQYSVTAMTPRQQVLESIVGGGVVQVVHQSLDSGSVWLGTAQLLNGQAHVLVGAGATADMARGAGRDKQTLATNHLLLGQGGGLALVIHLKSARYDRCQQEHVKRLKQKHAFNPDLPSWAVQLYILFFSYFNCKSLIIRVNRRLPVELESARDS